VTLGGANPILSFVEDAIATGLSALALIVPVAAIVAAGVLIYTLRRVFRAPRWG